MKSQHICLKLFRGKKQKSHYVELVFGLCQGFPHSSVGKESICNSGDPGLIPGLERSAGEERLPTPVFLDFPCGSAGKESTCNAGDLGLIPGLGRSPGEGKGYPLQHSGLENSMDCPWGRKKPDTTERILLSHSSHI